MVRAEGSQVNIIQNALIIGGGIAGMSAAIELRKRAVPVDLVEIDAQWRVYGAGITVSGAALRAFKALGIIQQVLDQGWCSDGADICGPDGAVLTKLPTPRIAGADIPGGGGILRPVLARILSQATLASGTAVRLGVTFTAIEPKSDAVDVTFSDGTHGRYDLVVGADGLNSKVRAALFPSAPQPKYTGQGCWRAVVPRPAEISAASIFMGRAIKAGVNPVSKDEMYLFCLDQREVPERIAEDRLTPVLTGMLAEFSGAVGQLRDGLNAGSRILYRPLESLMMPLPWHRDRVVLMGDAVHATTPHLASGAAISVEDALVLAEELEGAHSLEAALAAYGARRFERCRMVVENSLGLGAIEMSGGSREQYAQLMGASMKALLAPI
jgi:2-polyprenyl-6-methoxyphenol hydroxylase-like FAD-dependent oxidoreductase